jgi:hypothetical protein
VRPQLISLVMFALVAYLLYLYKWKKIDHLWLTAPIFILWSNLHGGYVLGLLLIASMVMGEFFNQLQCRQAEEVLARKDLARLGLWLVVGVLVVVINPNGVAMWAIPFKTVGVRALQEFIYEWGSPDFHQIAQQPFLWMLLMIFAAAGISPKRLDGSELISLAGFAYLAFMARRNFGPFAIVAAPVLSRHLYAWFLENQPYWQVWGKRWSAQKPSQPPVRNAINIVLGTVLIVLALMKVYLVSRPEIVEKYNTDLPSSGCCLDQVIYWK